MLYKIGVQYSIYGNVLIEANSKEEAFNIANDANNKFRLEDVNNASYLLDSWQADKDSINEVSNV